MNPANFVLGISTAGAVEVALESPQQETTAASDNPALEGLAKLVMQALRQAGASLSDVGLIGVCTGPGSFTGLRIGVAFAKSLAQARKLPIVGISAYDVAAFHIHRHPIIAVARGKQGYYYARIVTHPGAKPRFIAGEKDVIRKAAARLGSDAAPLEIAGPDFSFAARGDTARRVALLARQALEHGTEPRWTNIAIDYGQRPNAVANREEHHVANEEGPPLARPEIQVE